MWQCVFDGQDAAATRPQRGSAFSAAQPRLPLPQVVPESRRNWTRNETMLTSVARDQSSRRRALKTASFHKPNLYPYTACNPSASYSTETASPCPLVYRSLPKSSRPSVSLHRDVSSSCRSRCCMCQPPSMRIAQRARLL